MSIEDHAARSLCESEAIRSGWSVRQLDRQISTQFFERLSASAQPERMLENARKPAPVDPAELQHHIRDPYLLEFLDLKDEYSETDLEDAIVRHLEAFLLERGAAAGVSGAAAVSVAGARRRDLRRRKSARTRAPAQRSGP